MIPGPHLGRCPVNHQGRPIAPRICLNLLTFFQNCLYPEPPWRILDYTHLFPAPLDERLRQARFLYLSLFQDPLANPGNHPLLLKPGWNDPLNLPPPLTPGVGSLMMMLVMMLMMLTMVLRAHPCAHAHPRAHTRTRKRVRPNDAMMSPTFLGDPADLWVLPTSIWAPAHGDPLATAGGSSPP